MALLVPTKEQVQADIAEEIRLAIRRSKTVRDALQARDVTERIRAAYSRAAIYYSDREWYERASGLVQACHAFVNRTMPYPA